jgi:hypothetical protein
LNLTRNCWDPFVVAAADALGDFLVARSAPPAKSKRRGGADLYPFVAAQGRNAGETAALNGISLYAPHVAPDYDFASVRKLYGNFKVEKESKGSWGALVHALVD